MLQTKTFLYSLESFGLWGQMRSGLLPKRAVCACLPPLVDHAVLHHVTQHGNRAAKTEDRQTPPQVQPLHASAPNGASALINGSKQGPHCN